MIKITRLPKPTKLTATLVQKLTDEYNLNGTAVWKKKYITDQLLKMSFYKCCYCECKQQEEGKYVEVDHFKPKSLYKALVVNWGNLLPSCKRCNGAKGDHDTGKIPIIDPTIDDPQGHLRLKNYRFYGKTSLGAKTVIVVDLNDKKQKRLVTIRFKIGEKIIDVLEDLWDDLENCQQFTSLPTKKRNRIIGKFTQLLRESNPESIYSATAATILLDDKHYPLIKTKFQAFKIWTSEMDELEIGAQNICL